jgi:hypothetical protein
MLPRCLPRCRAAPPTSCCAAQLPCCPAAVVPCWPAGPLSRFRAAQLSALVRCAHLNRHPCHTAVLLRYRSSAHPRRALPYQLCRTAFYFLAFCFFALSDALDLAVFFLVFRGGPVETGFGLLDGPLAETCTALYFDPCSR